MADIQSIISPADRTKLNENFDNLNTQVVGHVSGISDRHGSNDIDNDSTVTGNTISGVVEGLKSEIDIISTADSNALIGVYKANDVTNTNNYEVSISGLTYFPDLRINLNATNINTGASTINVNALGVKSIKYLSEDGVTKNELVGGEISGYNEIQYDGVDFILVEKSIEALNARNSSTFGSFENLKDRLDTFEESIISTTDGASGMDLVGMTSIDGVMTTPQQSLEYLKIRVDATQSALNIVSVLDKGAVGDGITDDTQSFMNAIDDIPITGGILLIPSNQGYKITSQLDFTKAVKVLIGETTIYADLVGSLFHFTVNGSCVEGSKGTILKAGIGCTSIIHNDQTLHCSYSDFIIDNNSIPNFVGIFHDGGWYLSAKNIFSRASIEDASSYMIHIKSTNTGVAGSTGSYGGAFVSYYSNVNGGKIKITGDIPQKTTTITFTACSFTGSTISDSTSITFIQPVMQGAGDFFSLTNVAGLTCIGGDYEISGAGKVFVINDNNCSAIVSKGNQAVAGVTTSNYITGAFGPGAGSVFDDKGISGGEDANTRYGAFPSYNLKNKSNNVTYRYGNPWSTAAVVYSANLKHTARTTGNLDDETLNGLSILMDTSGNLEIYRATAGANPRTLSLYMKITGTTVTLPTIPTIAPEAGSKQIWADPADGYTVKFIP